jgi:hypothetical protein
VGTFVTCEENWAGYFRRPGDNAVPAQPHRDLAAPLRSYQRHRQFRLVDGDADRRRVFQRWDARPLLAASADGTGDYRNEPFQFGWCVEIDPYDPQSRPRKRTALGRMGHEGAWHGQWVAGRKVSVYLGDDARNEYFYKFISANAWDPSDAQRSDRLAVGDKYLDNGILYVARFNQDGTGEWLPLVFGQVPNRPAVGSDPAYVLENQADILINPRLAADAVGATRMDRPEWTATDNRTGEIYLTLTNNRAQERPLAATDAANPRHYNDPRLAGSNALGNPNGHIIRLREGGDNSESLTFTWDIYLFGADSADADAANVNLSSLDASTISPARRPVVFAAAESGRAGQSPIAVDPDGRRSLHRPHQQPDAGGAPRQHPRRRPPHDHQSRPGRQHPPAGDVRRRSRHAGDAAAIHGGADRMRDYRGRYHAGRPHHFLQHPAPRRRRQHRQPDQPLAFEPGQRTGAAPAVGHGGGHQE